MAEIVDFGLQQHKIKMDSRYFENVLSVVAGDTGRRIEVQLLDTNGMVQDTTGLNLRLNAEIAGKATFTDATLVDAATGKYQLDLSNGMFLAPGNWQFQWQITDSAGKKLHSFAFTGNIGKNISEGGSQATNFYLNLEDLKAMQDDLINGTIDSSILETTITEKLTALETQYAPKLTEVTAQLAQMVTNVTKLPIPMVAAKGDGITNDLGAIRNAINITPKGGVVFFPPTTTGYYVKNDSLKQLFLVDKPMTIVGQGINSTLKLDENIPLDTDVFLVSPSSESNNEGFNFLGMTIIGDKGSKPARHAIHLNTSLSHQKISRSSIEKNFLFPTGGHSVYLTNPSNHDGFYTSQIEKNLIYSGVKLQRAGDSILVEKNTFSGWNGIDIGLVSGSNSLIIEKNNLTSRRGIIVRSGHNIKIRDNNFEVGFSDAVYENNALIDIDGSEIEYDWGLLATEVTGNNVTYRSTAPAGIIGIRINKARGTLVEGNFIANKESIMIHITSSAQETRLGANLYSSDDPSGLIVDDGRNTIMKSVHKIGSSGAREVYETYAETARWRTRTAHYKSSIFNYQPLIESDAPNHNYMWSVSNTFLTKHTKTSQQINADGSLGIKKTISSINDGYETYNSGGFALTDPDGFKWKVNVDINGVLKTTRM